MSGLRRFKERTRWFRHNLVKGGLLLMTGVAPTFVRDVVEYVDRRESIQCVPRPFTNLVKCGMDGDLVGVEIGVARGLNAESLLLELPNLKLLYLVDPYRPYIENDVRVDCGFMELEAKRRLNRFKDRVVWIRELSECARDRLPFKVDFVYVDGNHGYKAVLNDLRIYYDLVKLGGVLGGHDFVRVYSPLTRAVLRFVYEKDLELFFDFPDFWVIKEES